MYFSVGPVLETSQMSYLRQQQKRSLFLGEIPSGNQPGSQYTHAARAWPGWDEKEEAPIMLLSLSLFPFQRATSHLGFLLGFVTAPPPLNHVIQSGNAMAYH